MNGQARVAARAGRHPATGRAEERRRIAPAIQLQQDLATRIQVTLDRQKRRRGDALCRGVLAQVDQMQRRLRCARRPIGQFKQHGLARPRAFEAFQRGCRGAEYHRDAESLRPHQRQVARGISEAFLSSFCFLGTQILPSLRSDSDINVNFD